MRCRCGEEIVNFPEHLLGIVEVRCKKCSASTPQKPGEERKKARAGRKSKAGKDHNHQKNVA